MNELSGTVETTVLKDEQKMDWNIKNSLQKCEKIVNNSHTGSLGDRRE